jgi:hypothetical protein
MFIVLLLLLLLLLFFIIAELLRIQDVSRPITGREASYVA